MRKLTHGSLFSGIGGFDLAAEWMGWDNKFHCEWNEFGQKVLNHYWPEAESFTDITKTDFKKYYGKIDILTGGFPCQPYSSAGKRKGKEDERHLWPEMLRAIREISPRFVVGENVRGLTNWNGGMVFEEVCVDLESYGYQVAPVIIPACSVNAPHRRERIWFVAYSINNRHNSERNEASKKNRISGKHRKEMDTREFDGTIISRFVAYANGTNQKDNRGTNDKETEKVWRQKECDVFREFCGDGNVTITNSVRQKYKLDKGEMEGRRFEFGNKSHTWDSFPTQPPICGGDDGIPDKLDGITFPKWRNESIKAYGNAIVPQVAYQIFKAIEKTLYL